MSQRPPSFTSTRPASPSKTALVTMQQVARAAAQHRGLGAGTGAGAVLVGAPTTPTLAATPASAAGKQVFA